MEPMLAGNFRSYSSLTILIVLLLATASGCGKKQEGLHSPLIDKYAANADRTSEVNRLNDRLFASVGTHVPQRDDLIGSEDLLHMTVFEAKDLETKARVNSRGCVTLPLLGEVEVKGLSAREAEEKIEDLYRRQYIKNPHVSIFVEERFSQRVTIVGQVKSPGTYDYLSKQRLMDVLALVGGLSDTAGRTVQIRRIGSEPGEHGMFIVDLDELINEGRTELNVEINGGDVIYVPEAGVYFVDGAVRRPGTYRIKEKIALREALIAAGGFASYANKDSVLLIRNKKGSEPKVTEIDLREPDRSELDIKDRDVIIAKDSTWGKMFHGTGINFGIPGFFWIGYHSPER